MERLNRRRPLQAKPDGLSRQQSAVEKAWQEQEARTAEAIPGGRLVPGSGCSQRPSRKSDVSGPWLRAEDKTTQDVKAKGFRVQRSHLAKIRAEAGMNKQQPAYVFGFDRDASGAREDWMAFPLSVAHTMLAVVDAVSSGDVTEAQELVELLTKAGG